MAQFEDHSLLALAESISTRAQALHAYLEKRQLAQPSLIKPEAGIDYLEEGDAEIQQVRMELRSAARQLDALAAGNARWGFERVICEMHDANVHHIVHEYDILHKVPLDGSISYADLAKQCGLDQDRLTRVLRYEMTNFIFTEPTTGFVAHSAASRKLVEPLNNAWFAHLAEDVYPAVSSTTAALKKWGSATAKHNETSFQYFYNTDQDIFTYFGIHHPERIERFGKAMQCATQMTMAGLLECNWAQFGKATLVDLGGSFGQKSIAIAEAAPEITCIVQDLESTISKVPPPPASVASRVSFEVQDFFEREKRTDMDLVLMARVFHDWPDEKCRLILENLVPSMKKGSRLILNESVTTPPYERPLMEQRLTYAVDMQMMVLLNSKERSLDDWKVLVSGGSSGKLQYEWHKSSLVCFIKA